MAESIDFATFFVPTWHLGTLESGSWQRIIYVLHKDLLSIPYLQSTVSADYALERKEIETRGAFTRHLFSIWEKQNKTEIKQIRNKSLVNGNCDKCHAEGDKVDVSTYNRGLDLVWWIRKDLMRTDVWTAVWKEAKFRDWLGFPVRGNSTGEGFQAGKKRNRASWIKWKEAGRLKKQLKSGSLVWS